MKHIFYIITTLLIFATNTNAISQTILINDQNKVKEQGNVSIKYNLSTDPFESFNRSMFNFNYYVLDKHIVRPIAVVYKNYVPIPIRVGVNNFTLNLDEPSSVVNNLLQGKFKWAANATGRFIVNSTFGLIGFVDIADLMGMPRKQDAFNEVLGYYGVSDGPYIMLPGYGPIVTREFTDYADNLYFPLVLLTTWQAVGKWGLEGLHDRTEALSNDGLLENSLDPYLFMKTSYIQHLEYKVFDGDAQETKGDEILDDYLNELQ